MRTHPAAQGTALGTVAEGMQSPKEAETAWGVGEEGDHEATELLSPGGAVGSSPKHFPSKTYRQSAFSSLLSDRGTRAPGRVARLKLSVCLCCVLFALVWDNL